MKQKLLTLLLIVVPSIAFCQSKPVVEFTNPDIQMGMVVSDLEKSLNFYTGIIGLKQTGEFKVAPEKAKELGLTDKLELKVSVLRLREGEDANQLKLMSFGEKKKLKKKKFINDELGVQYFTIYVKTLRPVYERLKENNIPLLGSTPVQMKGGNSFILIQDPDGTFIELIGPMD